MDIGLFISVIIIAFFAYIRYDNSYQKKYKQKPYNRQNTTYKPRPEPQSAQNTEYHYMPYTKRPLLTQTEQTFFKILFHEALKRRLLVCPKVRLEDIIYVTDRNNLYKYRGYIKSRHVDFVLLNNYCETVAAIELDDPSHNTKKAIKTDLFKNELFQTIKIPLIRIYVGANYIDEINYAFDTLNFPKAEPKPVPPKQEAPKPETSQEPKTQP